MNADFKFNLLDKVSITPLERNGKVVSIWITEHGIKYEVRYFDNAKVEAVYFYEDELMAIKS
jgi:hypothetical protein